MSRPGGGVPRPRSAFGWPRSLRLRRSVDFRRVQGHGRRYQTASLQCRVIAAPPGAGLRFGLAVSRKVGNAVVRNRVKRWLREALRQNQQGLPVVDLVIIARPEASTRGAAALRREVESLLARIQERSWAG